MEEQLTPLNPSEETHDESLCVNCKTNKFEEGHVINLCIDCRTALIHYPIPKWIRIFAIGLLAVILISLFRTQEYISAAIHLGRAEKAMEARHFATAQKEINKVLLKFPKDVVANADMIIAGSYNFDFESARQAYFNIEHKSIEDEALLAQINTSMDYIGQNFPKDTVTLQKINLASTDKTQLFKLYQHIDSTSANNEDLILKVHVANCLFELKEYESASDMMRNVLTSDSNFYSALSLMSAIKRNTGKYEEALNFCAKMLNLNKEDIYAISQQARIELKRRNDKDAAKYASEAMKINADNDSALEAKAMVDYFAGRKKESLAGLAAIKRHESSTGDQTISKRLTQIINGSEIYR